MLFRNKIEYTKQMFAEVYWAELRKMFIALRVVTGIGVLVGVLLVIRSAAGGAIRLGDALNLLIALAFFGACYYLPQWLARSQMKKCKKRGLLGKRTIRFTDKVMTMTYEDQGRSVDVSMDTLTGVMTYQNYLKLIIDGKSTYLKRDGFELGDAESFLAWVNEKVAENDAALEAEFLEEERREALRLNGATEEDAAAVEEAEENEEISEEDFGEETDSAEESEE